MKAAGTADAPLLLFEGVVQSPLSCGVVMGSSNRCFTVQRTLKLHKTVPQVSRMLQSLWTAAASITSKHSGSKMIQDP